MHIVAKAGNSNRVSFHTCSHPCIHLILHSEPAIVCGMLSSRYYKYNREQGKDLGLGVEIKANTISQIIFPGAFTFSTLSLVFKKKTSSVVTKHTQFTVVIILSGAVQWCKEQSFLHWCPESLPLQDCNSVPTKQYLPDHPSPSRTETTASLASPYTLILAPSCIK